MKIRRAENKAERKQNATSPKLHALTSDSKMLVTTAAFLSAALLVLLGTSSFFVTREPIVLPLVVEQVLDMENLAISEVNAVVVNT